MDNIKKAIQSGETILGIELGSTRIKAVLIAPDHTPIASGSHNWENRLENNIWTYRLEMPGKACRTHMPIWQPKLRKITACP